MRPVLRCCVPKAVMVLDNTLQQGRVCAESRQGIAASIHELNQFIQQDKRVHALLLPLADGMTIVRKI